MFAEPALFLVSRNPEGYAAATRALARQGIRRFHLIGGDELADRVAARISGEHGASSVLRQATPRDILGSRPPNHPGAAVVLFDESGEQLSRRLHQFIDTPVALIAPKTEHHFAQRRLTVISIPKAGFHLLAQALANFGIVSGGRLADDSEPGRWYTLDDHPHAVTRRFFTRLAEEPRGGVDHPFFSAPCIFLYRHPADIVLSELHYFERADVSAVSHYFAALEPKRRLNELVSGNALAGDIGMRMYAYAPWLELHNVIPVSFEEIVGSPGGGLDEEQLRCLWSLQMKLQIPGRTRHFASMIGNSLSETRRKGRINGDAPLLGPKQCKDILSFGEQCLTPFGYDLAEDGGRSLFSKRVREFRLRPVGLRRPAAVAKEESRTELEERQVYRYRGYYVTLLTGRYWAVPPQNHPFNPVFEPPPHRTKSAPKFGDLIAAIDADPLDDDRELRTTAFDAGMLLWQWSDIRLVNSGTGRNVVRFRNLYYSLPHALGPVDFEYGPPASLPGMAVGVSPEAIELLDASDDKPVSVARNLFAHDVLAFKGRFHCVPQRLRSSDLTDAMRGVDSCATYLGARKLLLERWANAPAAIDQGLVWQGVAGFDVMAFRGRYVAAPQAAGTIDPAGLPRLPQGGTMLEVGSAMLDALGADAATDMPSGGTSHADRSGKNHAEVAGGSSGPDRTSGVRPEAAKMRSGDYWGNGASLPAYVNFYGYCIYEDQDGYVGFPLAAGSHARLVEESVLGELLLASPTLAELKVKILFVSVPQAPTSGWSCPPIAETI